jgi:hypothetical protein
MFVTDDLKNVSPERRDKSKHRAQIKLPLPGRALIYSASLGVVGTRLRADQYPVPRCTRDDSVLCGQRNQRTLATPSQVNQVSLEYRLYLARSLY